MRLYINSFCVSDHIKIYKHVTISKVLSEQKSPDNLLHVNVAISDEVLNSAVIQMPWT